MIGRTISHYLIEERLGKGGMGEVFLARDLRLERRVAIKILAEEGDLDGDGQRRFVAEAKAASALNHPNIVTVHDFDQEGTLRFLVMEAIEGEALDPLHKEPCTLERFLDLASQITSALGAAHAAGIVHHDIKPANLMMTRSGTVKVVDFGLARRLATPAIVTPGPRAGEDDPTIRQDHDVTRATGSDLTAPGTILGTVAYMAPEQLEGQRGSARSDVFALGILFFELLTGERPFDTSTPVAAMAAILRDQPRNLEALRRDLPRAVVELIQKCLTKDPALRFADAGEVKHELQSIQARLEAQKKPSLLNRRSMAITAGLLLFFGLAASFWWRGQARLRWARESARPEIERLFNDEKTVEAWLLAEKALAIAPNDSQLRQAWVNMVYPIAIQSEPEGAEVAIKSYRDPTAAWHVLGQTPIANIEIPYPLLRFRVAKAGYSTLEVAPEVPGTELIFKMTPESRAKAGMVAVAGGKSEYRGKLVDLPDFWIDRFEVTNAEFQEFVDAGGYRQPALWEQAFESKGRALTFEQGMAGLTDSTGRPGPLGWAFGRFPEGQDAFPVEGVSWHEAAAFANFVGKSLPTVYHWARAAARDGIFSDIVTLSNFSGQASQKVGANNGLGPWGTLDMAGNVEEWCWNAEGERRIALGGSYLDASYQYIEADGLPALERRPGFGLRLITQEEKPDPAAIADLDSRAYEPWAPVDDETFALYARLFDYDPRPLDARAESVDESHNAWRKEKVSFTSAYSSERIPAYLFLPKNTQPPYQTIIFFPGSDAVYSKSSRNLWLRMVDFFVRSGRVVVYPIYQGTYERRLEAALGPNGTRRQRIERVQDVRRTLDYLETRTDIDQKRIAYYGLSLGANTAPFVLATDRRFHMALLFGGGLRNSSAPPEVKAENFLPRVSLPVLFIGGRYDFTFPHESSQLPFFERIGSPEKRLSVFEGGHLPTQLTEVVREMLAFTDQQMGSVELR